MEGQMKPLAHQEKLVEDVLEKGQDKVLLWWGLGTGKTAASYFLSEAWNDDVKLIVCPKSLVGMWTSFLRERLVEKGDEDTPVTDLTKPKYAKTGPEIVPGWYVINYDKLSNRDWIANFKDCTVVLDESSFVKHYSAKRTRAAVDLAFKSRHLALLSGTPCGGKWEDMWTHLLMLGRPMKRAAYLESFCNMVSIRLSGGRFQDILNKKNPYRNLDILMEDLADHGMHRLRTEECIDLPETTDMTIQVGMPTEYRRFDEKGEVEVEGERFVAKDVPTVRMALRRIASSYNGEKLDALSDLLQSTDERVVVFHQFQEDAKRIIELCRKLDKPYAVQNGQRHDLEDLENSNYAKHDDCVCIVQWQSGGYGLNLQKARLGVFFSLPDSYELYAQARGRIHRNGQTLPCIYYNISAAGTIDERIKEALDSKEDYGDKRFLKDYARYAGLSMVAKELPKDYSIEAQPTLFGEVEGEAVIRKSSHMIGGRD